MQCYLQQVDGTAIALGAGRTTIGREGCDFNLPYRGISLKHATITVENQAVWIEDEGSKNGTYVNKTKRLEPNCPVQIHHGDVIRISRSHSTQFAFKVGEPSDVETPSLNLVEVARALNDYLEEDEVLRLLLNLAVNAVQADRGFILPMKMVRLKSGRPVACWPESARPEGTFEEWGILEEPVLDAAKAEALSVGKYSNLSSRASSFANSVLCMQVLWREVDRFAASTATQDVRKACIVYLECSSRAAGFGEADQKALRALFDHVAASLTAKHRAELEMELRTAAKIQQQLLQRDFSTWSTFDLCGHNVPTRFVGGDFYEFVEIGTNRLGIALGDVSGHGLPAALMMSGIMASVWNNARSSRGPAEVLRSVDGYARCHFRDGAFASMFYGELHSSGVFRWISAGHYPPIVIRERGQLELFRIDSGVGLLGDVESAPWPPDDLAEQRTQLVPQDVVVVFSDGLVEARANECYGQARLHDVLRSASPGMSCQDIVALVIKSLREFARGEVFDDDVTLLVARFLGQPQRTGLHKPLQRKLRE